MNDIVDMSQFVEAKSDQLNSDDLIGGPRTITVAKVTGNDGDQPISIHYQGDNGKPYKPCKTIRRVLLAIWGRNASEYVGRSMTLYRDDSVTFGGLNVGGLRISHMSNLDKETVVVVMKTKGKKAGIKILPLANVPTTQTEDRAEAWTNAYIGKLQGATTLEEVAGLENTQAARLTDLKGKRPELHERIAAAAEARRGQLTPADDLDAGFDEPTEADRSVDQTIADAKAATDSATLEAIIAESEQHKIALTDDQVMRLEIAFSQERARLAPAEGLV